jgi:ABC-type transport system involved in multi-copper enzyme maturation permease subunit
MNESDKNPALPTQPAAVPPTAVASAPPAPRPTPVAVQPKPPTTTPPADQAWARQIGAVLRMELKKTFLSKRGWWIYFLALGPVLLTLIHWMFESRRSGGRHSMGEDSVIFAGLFMFYYLRAGIFFGCMGIFSNLFRGEMLEKTLHYYFLTPMRREMLVAGKYLAGLIVAVVLFVGSSSLSFLIIGKHFGAAWTDYVLHGPGMHQLGAYALVATLACIGYGAVFLMCGLFFKNPMIAAAIVWVWENLNPFLPAVLKKISVIFYLKNLCPVEVPVPPPFNVMVIEADPSPFWVAVPGLLLLSLIFLVYSGISARNTEINYGE